MSGVWFVVPADSHYCERLSSLCNVGDVLENWWKLFIKGQDEVLKRLVRWPIRYLVRFWIIRCTASSSEVIKHMELFSDCRQEGHDNKSDIDLESSIACDEKHSNAPDVQCWT